MSRKKVQEATIVSERPHEVLAVLKKSPEERKQFYRDDWRAHRNIEAAADELLRLIREPAGAEIIYLIGLTGVGKTTLTKFVISKLFEMALPVIGNFPGHVPAAYLEAENPDRGSYDWGTHYVNTMIALDEILIDKKVYLPGPPDIQGKSALPTKGDSRRMAQRAAAENTLMNRIMYAFFVDEAQYITKRKSGEGLTDQADTIRSLAARSKTLHVLAGTFDLRLLINLSGQLGRRSHIVHFKRYKIDGLSGQEKASELEEFAKAFMSLQAYLPVESMPNLERHLDFCFERCVGCVGHLKSWFLRALAMALDDKLQTVNSEVFLKATPKKEVWRRILQEAADGESALEEIDDELDKELAKLGRSDDQTGQRAENRPAKKARETPAPGKKRSAAKLPKGRPFVPKPERYPVGIKRATS